MKPREGNAYGRQGVWFADEHRRAVRIAAAIAFLAGVGVGALVTLAIAPEQRAIVPGAFSAIAEFRL